jgi:hypothetical protein
MPPRERFSFEKVLETAFTILRKSGLKAVTARAIAKALKASTMPIYSAIGSMRNLEKKLRYKALGLFAEYQVRPYTDNTLLNMAVGQVVFARDEPELYRFIQVDKPVPISSKEQKELSDEVSKRLGKPIPYKTYFGSMKPAVLDAVSFKAWIFTHGLAMGVMSGNLGKMTEKEIIGHLSEAGWAFTKWANSKNKTP